MDEKLMNFLLYAFLVFIGLVAGIQFSGYLQRQEKSKILNEEIKTLKGKGYVMSNDNEIKSMEKLEALRTFIESIDFEKFAKERILNTVNSELDHARRQVYLKLGEEIYKKESNERTAMINGE